MNGWPETMLSVVVAVLSADALFTMGCWILLAYLEGSRQ